MQIKANTAITAESRRFLCQAKSNPGRALALSELRERLRQLLISCGSVRRDFAGVCGHIQRSGFPQKMWLSEARFLGYVVGSKPRTASKFLISCKQGGTEIRIRRL